MVASFFLNAGFVAAMVGIATLVAVAILIEMLERGWRFAWLVMSYLSGKRLYSVGSFVRRSDAS